MLIINCEIINTDLQIADFSTPPEQNKEKNHANKLIRLQINWQK